MGFNFFTKAVLAVTIMIFSLTLIPLESFAGAQQDERNIFIKALKGKISLNDNNGKNLVIQEEKYQVLVGNTINTDDQSLGLLEYTDGTKLNLAENTELKIALGGIKIKKGKTWMYFVKQKNRFVIQAPAAIMGIMGTALMVEVNDAGITTMSVFSGAVSMSTDTSETVVKGGETAVARLDKTISKNPTSSELTRHYNKKVKALIEPAEKNIDLGLGFPVVPVIDTPAVEEKPGNEEPVGQSVAASGIAEKIVPVQTEEPKVIKSTLKGDLNDDLKRDDLDVELLRRHVFNEALLDGRRSKLADVDESGSVNENDLRVLDFKVKKLGDFNRDGSVDESDFVDLKDAIEYGSEDRRMDLNGDGKINNGDLMLFRQIRKIVNSFSGE